MAFCVSVDASNMVVYQPTSSPCPAVILTSDEYQTLINTPDAAQVLTDLNATLVAAFATPSTTEIISAFMAAFSLPIVLYLTAYAYQFVINFASNDTLEN